jgi:uncharacterized Zn-binding protein involved in type VI secretion
MAEKGVARLGDTGSHGGKIISGSDSIIVNDRPMARVGDIYACPTHGNNPIISGVTTIFGEGMLVAHVGSLTACGAKITSGSSNTVVDDTASGITHKQSSTIESILEYIFGDKPAVPSRGIPEEIVCNKLAQVRSSKQVQDKLRETLQLSRDNKWEYCGWFVENPPDSGNFDVVNISTDKEPLSCTPGPKPPNAVGEFHTHPNAGLAFPSPQDEFFVTRQKEKVNFYLIFANSGHEEMQNDAGEVFYCPRHKPFFSPGDFK